MVLLHIRCVARSGSTKTGPSRQSQYWPQIIAISCETIRLFGWSRPVMFCEKSFGLKTHMHTHTHTYMLVHKKTDIESIYRKVATMGRYIIHNTFGVVVHSNANCWWCCRCCCCCCCWSVIVLRPTTSTRSRGAVVRSGQPEPRTPEIVLGNWIECAYVYVCVMGGKTTKYANAHCTRGKGSRGSVRSGSVWYGILKT